MKVKNVEESEYFTAVDGSKITELFGMPTEKIKEMSLAYAKVTVGKKTDEHLHKFWEIYTIVKGRGRMHLDGKEKEVGEGDSVLIPSGKNHFIENIGEGELEFYCFCVPAFTPEETEMKEK